LGTKDEGLQNPADKAHGKVHHCPSQEELAVEG
jgi:hypothetical protein